MATVANKIQMESHNSALNRIHIHTHAHRQKAPCVYISFLKCMQKCHVSPSICHSMSVRAWMSAGGIYSEGKWNKIA